MTINHVLTVLNTTQDIKDLLRPNIESLVFMLCGKNNDFSGPLNDGYQNNDWIAICIVCSTWLLSLDYSLTGIQPNDVAKIIFDLVYNLVKYDTIKLSPEDRDATLKLLSVGEDLVLFQIILNVEKIYKSLSKHICTCVCFKRKSPVDDLLKNQVKQLNK